MLLPLFALPLPMGLLLRAGGGGGGLMVVALGMAMFFGLACLRGLMPYTNTAFFSNSALRNVAKTVHINCKLAGMKSRLSAQTMHTFWMWPRRRELSCHTHAVFVRAVQGGFLKENQSDQAFLDDNQMGNGYCLA